MRSLGALLLLALAVIDATGGCTPVQGPEPGRSAGHGASSARGGAPAGRGAAVSGGAKAVTSHAAGAEAGVPVVASASGEPARSTGQGGGGPAGRAASESASIGVEAAMRALFLDRPPAPAAGCRARERKRAITCLIELRYAADPLARESALTLFRETGTVAGVERPHRMDGGWRGEIDLVPELPAGRHRHHLVWLLAASRDIEAFFAALARHATRPLAYRHRPLAVRFFRSVGRTTPSAYAGEWSVAYNVAGSLNRSAAAVRETFFHEVFHLNDRAHGHWSARVLAPLYERVVAHCTSSQGDLDTRCLQPYAPHRTLVRGGTYYAFQPGNGVAEYAAELATRYYREQRARLSGRPLARRPFKCGPAPNGRAWGLLVEEFFGGTDLTGRCP